MAFKRLLNNYLDTGTTVLTSVVAGTITGGPTLNMQLVRQDINTLSALVTLDMETNTITGWAYWQVSNDDSTWVDVPTVNNAAVVLWATGTAGADAVVTKALPAPDCVLGWRYARVAVVLGVTNGLIADTYRIGYNFEKDEYVV